jgi:DNA-binding transcriptional regulator YiaG
LKKNPEPRTAETAKARNPATEARTPAAQWVREARATAKLSQSGFASQLGVHWVTVSNWERGKYAPDWDSAEKIRKAVPGTPPAPGLLPPSIADRVDGRPRTLEAAEVAAIIDGLRPELRSYVRDTVYRIVAAQSVPSSPPKPGVDGVAHGRSAHRR